jgi:hypothetical protein
MALFRPYGPGAKVEFEEWRDAQQRAIESHAVLSVEALLV